MALVQRSCLQPIWRNLEWNNLLNRLQGCCELIGYLLLGERLLAHPGLVPLVSKVLQCIFGHYLLTGIGLAELVNSL